MVIKELTKEQISKMEAVKDLWLGYIFNNGLKLNKEAAIKGINWLYSFTDLTPPKDIVFMGSPQGCIKYCEKLKISKGEILFSSYGSVSDYGWVANIEAFKAIGVIIDNPAYELFKGLLLSGIYDMVQLNDLCVVSALPDRISRNAANLLHSADSSAVHFTDGYELYFWNGVNVPERWIKQKDSLTSTDIMSENNAEKRRCLREILGAANYYALLGGVELIDEDTDNQGNPMKLYKTKKIDDVIKTNVIFLEVVCPSTKRVYNIYPPNQLSKNVWEAKASTFDDKNIQYRHGDVGLLNLEQNFKTPEVET